jgi:hypothetical protein
MSFTKMTTGLVAGATMLVAAAPAEAQYRGYRHNRGGDRTALAIGAGALGLAVGAALASSNRGYRDRGYYGRGYYGNRGYYGGSRYDGYYGRPYAYGYGSYGRPYGYGGGYYAAQRRSCWTDRVWDDYRGRWRKVRVCDRY